MSTSIEIKKLKFADLAKLTNLMLELSAYYDGLEDVTLHVADLNDRKRNKLDDAKEFIGHGYVWGAFTENFLIGYIAFRLLGPDHHSLPNTVFIAELYVKEEFRTGGIATRLINRVLQSDFPDKYTRFSVTHSPLEPGLTAFYEKFGFKVLKVLESGNIALIRDVN